MKNIKKILILSASALAGLGLASCGPEVSSSNVTSSEESSTVVVTTTKLSIVDEGIPYVEVNAVVDFEQYIVCKMSDGSTGTAYTLTCASDKVTINGHKVTATEVGDYTITVTSGDKTIRAGLTVKTKEGLEVINFLKPLAANPQNYTIDTYDLDKTQQLVYGGSTYIHNPSYVAIFDKTNIGSVDDKGEPNSTILAQLSNGNAYWGSFDSTGKPVFAPGSASYGDYYITGDLVLDGADFVSTFDEKGEESLSASATFTQSLLNYGMSQLPERYGYSYSTTDLLGFADTNGDDVNDTMLLLTNVKQGEQEGYWTIAGLHSIGSTNMKALDDAIVDDAYLPAAITAPEVATAFDNIRTTSNFSTLSMWPSDQNGDPLAEADITDKSAYATMIFGNKKTYSQIVTSTAEGLDVVYGFMGVDADNKPVLNQEGGMALFNRDGASYQAITTKNKDTGALSTTTKAVEGVTDVWTLAKATALTARAITTTGINSTEFTDKTAAEGVVTLTGKMGDNDGTTVTNILAQQILDQCIAVAFSAEGSTTNVGLGTYLTDAVEFNGGNKHALTVYSEYSAISVTTATNMVFITGTIYLPIGGDATDNYIGFGYMVNGVGATNFDFSKYVAA